jgi:hypothetical protein
MRLLRRLPALARHSLSLLADEVVVARFVLLVCGPRVYNSCCLAVFVILVNGRLPSRMAWIIDDVQLALIETHIYTILDHYYNQ